MIRPTMHYASLSMAPTGAHGNSDTIPSTMDHHANRLFFGPPYKPKENGKEAPSKPDASPPPQLRPSVG